MLGLKACAITIRLVAADPAPHSRPYFVHPQNRGINPHYSNLITEIYGDSYDMFWPTNHLRLLLKENTLDLDSQENVFLEITEEILLLCLDKMPAWTSGRHVLAMRGSHKLTMTTKDVGPWCGH